MIEQLQNFTFKGMLLSSNLEGLEEQGILTKPAPSLPDSVNSEVPLSLEDFSPKIRGSAIKMGGVYTAFYCFENSVRELVIERLKEKVGTKWWSQCVSKKIRDEVKRRQAQDNTNRWHAPRAIDNMAYTDYSDMVNIICVNWSHFEDLFPSQDWVRTRLSDLEQSRNAIAHNNLLAERDISRIDMYLEDWKRQVG